MVTPPRGYIYRPVKTPCMGCKERTVGCHAKCEKYAQYRVELEAEKSTAYNASVEQNRLMQYEIESARRYKRGGR